MVRAAQKGEGASSPEVAKVAASIKKKDAKDFASTKHKGLPEKKMKSFKEATYPQDFKGGSVAKKKTDKPNAQGDYGKKDINEEDADRLRDRRMERGGVDGNTNYRKPPAKKLSNAELGIKPGKTQLQKDAEKKYGKGASAMDIVKAQIRAKHGKGAIMDTKKKNEEMLFNGVNIFEEMSDFEISLISNSMIEEIVTEVFEEEMAEGREIDSITDMLCESVDYSLSFLTEVSDSYYDSAVKASKEASKKPEVKAANRRAKLEKVKSTAKKVGSALKSGLKSGAKLARKGAVKGAEVAGKAVGHAKNLAKDMGSAAKKGYDSTQKSSSSSSSSDSDSSSSSSSSDSSSSESKPKKPGLLSRIGSKLKRGIKKAVGAGARSLSRGARNVARKLGEEIISEMPYQVMGYDKEGGKEKKVGKPVKSKKYAAARAAELSDTHKKTGGKYRSEYTEETIVERGDFWHPDPEKDKKLGGPGANQRAREDRAATSKPKEDPKKLKKGESYMDYAKRQKAGKSSYMSSGSTARERLQKAGAKMSPPKERKRDKIGRAIGSAIDRVAGIKKEEVMSFKQFIGE